MTYKQKLIDLLKSDDEVKSAIEKLEFGTDLFYKNWEEWITTHETFIWMSHPYNWTSPQPIIKNHHNYCIIKDIDIEDIKRLYILTKPLQERFIRMYCLSKWYNCSFQNNNLIAIEKVWIDDIDIENNKQLLYKLISYELLKDFNSQSEEVYQKIYEVLNNLITK